MRLDTLLSDLSDLTILRDPAQLRKLSLDYYHFSPILQPQLADRRADAVIRPRDEAEVIRVAAACAQHRIPLTIRGAGTGNYGQCIPLEGGIVLDMTALDQLLWLRNGVARVQTGARLAALDRQLQPQCWELRMVPSTYQSATIGGFIGGGSGGIGSITWGQLRDTGNLRAARVVTVEESPRVLELRGHDVQTINHAYGCTGIIIELEIPLAPAYRWTELAIGFGNLHTACDFAAAIARADGLIRKLVTVLEAAIVPMCPSLRHLPSGETAVILILAEASREDLEPFLADWGGTVHLERGPDSSGASLMESSWNHTTLHARAVDPVWTYLQSVLPEEADFGMIRRGRAQFPDEVLWHLEFLRFGGRPRAAALPLIRFTTPERLQQIVHWFEEQGAILFDPHTYWLEDGGMKQVNPAQVAFKVAADPYGLLNPGKMRGWIEHVAGIGQTR